MIFLVVSDEMFYVYVFMVKRTLEASVFSYMFLYCRGIFMSMYGFLMCSVKCYNAYISLSWKDVDIIDLILLRLLIIFAQYNASLDFCRLGRDPFYDLMKSCCVRIY